MKPQIKYQKILPVLLLILAFPNGNIMAQLADSTGIDTGLRGAPRIQKIDSRSAALAGSTVADIAGNSSVNMNPALIAFVRNSDAVEFNYYHNWNNNLVQHIITPPSISYKNHHFIFQTALFHDGNGTGNIKGSAPLPVPDFTMFDLGLGYAISYENILSIGIYNNVSYGQNTHSSDLWTYYSEIGVLYAPSRNITYGAVFRGLGRSIMYEFDESGASLLMDQRIRQVLELGATLKFPVDSDRPQFAISFSNEKHFGRKGIWYKGGLEVNPAPSISLRSGIIFEPDQKIYAPRYGIGINTRHLQLHFSISPKQLHAERFHQAGLAVKF